MTLDGVIDAPTWTFDYGFHPRMGEAIGAVTERCRERGFMGNHGGFPCVAEEVFA
jgi:hypothetical protein